MHALLQDLHPVVNEAIDSYNRSLQAVPRLYNLVRTMSAAEQVNVKNWQISNLLNLLDSGLTAQRHEILAREAGIKYVLSSVTKEDLAFTKDLLFATVCKYVDRERHSQALAVFSARIMRDLAWQLVVFQEVYTQRNQILLKLTRLALEAHSYSDLIAETVALLVQHPGVSTCFVGRPDGQAFSYEVLAGQKMESYLTRIQEIRAAYVQAGMPWPGQGPAQRAWSSDRIEFCFNIGTDTSLPPWREVALSYGFRSIAAVPVGSQPDVGPVAILGMYCDHPGGFSSDDQVAFLEQLRALLTFAIRRFEAQEGVSRTIPHSLRRRWSNLIKSDDTLRMHYQPLLDLKSRRIFKVEAVARLLDNGQVLTPGRFFPALTSEDFYVLYVQGLNQVLRQRVAWEQQGVDLQISVNMPSDALADCRYYQATQDALREHNCPGHKLMLEILETHEMPAGVDVAAELARYKELGVGLAEDDLGAGHSSLMRMRELPFDTVKIDRSLVALNGENAADVLHFIYQLTRLGHALGKSVAVEGVEDIDLLEAVAILGADEVQGYVLSAPLSADALSAWLADYQQRPVRGQTQSVMTQMARLLIWEECLHLLRDEANATGAIADINTAVLPFRDIDPGIQRVFVLTAVSHGPGSPEYRQAREQLMRALIARTN